MSDTPGTSSAWTTRRLLAWISDALTKKGIESPRRCAEELLAHVLACKRLKLFMEADREATPQELERLRALVGRALKHEPVQYLVEGWSFFGVELRLDKRVLIPRSATEAIVEHVLQSARGRGQTETDASGRRREVYPNLRFADLCTGSGAIALALLKNLPGSSAVITDISEEALSLAHENALIHRLDERIESRQGDLVAPLLADQAWRNLDFVVSNPPYIPDREWAAVAVNVKDYEPHIALRGGPDGLDFVRPILAAGPSLLRPGGQLVVEVAASTTGEALALVQEDERLTGQRVLSDSDGLPRVIIAELLPAS
ncbi:MAG: peptide chain release factor N(5)-glutamine methyltransferase [Phycisphaerales bacterium]|nr:peptide chain release factor N(5)-glutamine methyltransferase [Phycisphaerales bacterium]